MESHFPGTIFCSDVTQVTESDVTGWACTFSQCAVIIIGAGPPCQGVSGLKSERKGALKDERSRLFKEVPRITHLVKRHFPWAMVHLLMESVLSMDDSDRETMSREVELQPWSIDAVGVSLARRPRLYWITWELQEGEGVMIHPPRTEDFVDFGIVDLQADVNEQHYLKKGWSRTQQVALPTFTTSRPRSEAGPRPAGLKNCLPHELQRWQQDKHRFPPYQYKDMFLVVNGAGEQRLVDVEERETIMGFPIGYTSQCVNKSQAKGEAYNDQRLTLLGNSWNVTVVTWLLAQLLHSLGLTDSCSPQKAVRVTSPGGSSRLQGLLLRPRFSGKRYDKVKASKDHELTLSSKLCGLVSVKGEDILLSADSEPQVKHHRLRSSVPAKLWKWRTICGWRWTGASEHINCLELRAVLTSVRWRLEKKRQSKLKFIHLVDSQVVLHSLSRGRSSSRKLRRTLLRINSLLLATGSSGVWAYVHTSQNPADRPSRKPVKKRWVK